MQHHGIASAVYSTENTSDNAPVEITRGDGKVRQGRANDDIDGGGMLAFLAGGGVIGKFVPPPIKSSAVDAERERRMALGFKYDFGDARGAHHIGTTAADLAGWRDVTDYANALIDTGDTTTEIAIVTDTGPASVTAPEWQAVMLQAAVVRQKIWAKSFALQSMNPIPSDYANDAYWS